MPSPKAIVGLLLAGWMLPVWTAETRTSSNSPIWGQGLEGQRKADLGNGTYRNPILAGDHPDPSVLKDGSDYYMVHSSFDNCPGLLLWHSKDLVNWQPVGPALHKNVGTVWAPDLVKHKGRYYIYFPALSPKRTTNMVVWADHIEGPWSDPIDLNVTGFYDPGHAASVEGKRYLFFSGGMMAPLAEDGLSVTAPAKKVYEGWQYPQDWDVETFAQEGPKILHHGDYYYMVLAEGGTSGPATSHMVIMARSKNLEGPWENAPNNPVVKTRSASEKWWSRGHATLVEGPDKKWYFVYHGYENGYYNLGRQTLLEPVAWTKDGWVRALGQDISGPLPKPQGPALPHGLALSDDFSRDAIGLRWAFFNADSNAKPRHHFEDHALVLEGRGTSPRDCSPLTLVAGDQAYEVQVELELTGKASGGLLLFYNDRLYTGLGFSPDHMLEYRCGDGQSFDKPKAYGNHLWLKLRNDHHVVTLWHSADGKTWTRYWMQMEVSGYHHNVMGGFYSLRPALFSAGEGQVKFMDFRYRALP